MKIGTLQTKNNIFLAPMAGVTDRPFRDECVRMGAGLVYSEMVSAKGLAYGNRHTRVLLASGDYPCGVQLFGSDPETQLVIGSRRLAKDGYEGYTFIRKLASKTYLKVLATAAGFKLSDSQCGFKCYRGAAGKKIFEGCEVDGFAFDFEALIRAQNQKRGENK